MTAPVRWLKFNVVGAVGMGVQLGALAGFNRLLHGHYLVATGAALELTLLHNFFWHERFTWRDRRASVPRLRALLRFHAANGLVSLLGNLMLMRLLVQGGHVPLLVANGIAIVCCSLANYGLGSRWAFALPMRTMSSEERTACQ